MSEEEGAPAAEAFTLPEEGEHEPREIAGRLVAREDEFADLRTGEAAILFLMRAEPKVKNGRRELGSMSMPNFQGAFGAVGTWLLAQYCGGDLPDYVMILDTQFWRQATPHQREALVFHELMHATIAEDRHGEKRFTAEGKPVWGIRGHDIEEFNLVARRYGRWLGDIEGFLAALREGGHL